MSRMSLDRDRHAVQRRRGRRPARQLGVALARLAARLVGHHQRERVERSGFARCGAGRSRYGIDAGDFAGAQTAAELLRWSVMLVDGGLAGVGSVALAASSLKSAARSAVVAQASVSMIGFSSGSPRDSASRWPLSARPRPSCALHRDRNPVAQHTITSQHTRRVGSHIFRCARRWHGCFRHRLPFRLKPSRSVRPYPSSSLVPQPSRSPR